MTCKDCIHCDVCKNELINTEEGIILIDESESVEHDCPDYKRCLLDIGDVFYALGTVFDQTERKFRDVVVPYCISEIIISRKGVVYHTENDYEFCENKIGTEMFLTRGGAEDALRGVAK